MESLQQNKYLMIDYEEKVEIKLKRLVFWEDGSDLHEVHSRKEDLCEKKREDLYQPEKMEFEDLTPKESSDKEDKI